MYINLASGDEILCSQRCSSHDQLPSDETYYSHINTIPIEHRMHFTFIHV